MSRSARFLRTGLVTVMLCIGLSFLGSCARALPQSLSFSSDSSSSIESYRKAAAYSEANDGLSMLVLQRGNILFESYAPGLSADQPLPLASGTKSFSCAIAVAAIQDGWLSFDEPVSQTLSEWRSDPSKAIITIRQLLSLTSGIPGGRIGRVPTYAQAIAQPSTAAPATQFQYGPVPFQIFGEVIRRKLSTAGLPDDPLVYLNRKVFSPLGLKVGAWTRSADGMPNLPSGASLTAREWAKFGALIADTGTWKGQRLLKPELLRQCFQGSTPNPAYGLTFWLNAKGVLPSGHPFPGIKQVPANLVMAIGAGNQVLYIFPTEKLVIVRQGRITLRSLRENRGFEHEQFLRLALGKR